MFVGLNAYKLYVTTTPRGGGLSSARQTFVTNLLMPLIPDMLPVMLEPVWNVQIK